MQDFDKILAISADERVELGQKTKELLNTWLMLGMTRYVCRNGTLSDGHECITDAQKYAQCHREIWSRSNAIIQQKALAMEAQADLIDAEDELKTASKASTKLRAESKVLNAKQKLSQALVNMEDTMRQLDEFNKVRASLKEKVEAEYPMGLEQSEEANWIAVAKYRAGLENATGINQYLRHVPLEGDTKARVGVTLNKPELVIGKSLQDPHGFNKLVESIKLEHK